MVNKKSKGRPGNEVVEQQIVRLDYQTFERKSFYKCTLVYAGGVPPVLKDCDFVDSTFVFEGPAWNTAGFMASIAQSGDGGRQLVLGMLGLK